MFNRELLTDLFRHMEWADAAVWRAVREGEQAVVAREDPMLRGYLVHLHSVQQAFLNAWTRHPPSFRDAASFSTMDEAYDWARPYYPRLHSFVAGVADAALSEEAVMPWASYIEQQLGRPIAATTLGETMMQVASHSTHHRGQANARLRALGVHPPMVDYIAWLWDARPQAEWP